MPRFILDDLLADHPDEDPDSYTARCRKTRRAAETELDRRVRLVAERAKRKQHSSEVKIRWVDPESLR